MRVRNRQNHVAGAAGPTSHRIDVVRPDIRGADGSETGNASRRPSWPFLPQKGKGSLGRKAAPGSWQKGTEQHVLLLPDPANLEIQTSDQHRYGNTGSWERARNASNSVGINAQNASLCEADPHWLGKIAGCQWPLGPRWSRRLPDDAAVRAG